MPERPELLTVDEVARRLRLNRQTVYRMIDDGRLPAPIRIGAAVRFRTADIDALIAPAGGDK